MSTNRKRHPSKPILPAKTNRSSKKFIPDNGLALRAYTQFGKVEMLERTAVLTELVWNDTMFI